METNRSQRQGRGYSLVGVGEGEQGDMAFSEFLFFQNAVFCVAYLLFIRFLEQRGK